MTSDYFHVIFSYKEVVLIDRGGKNGQSKRDRRKLKAINFNIHGWGRGEIKELASIILPEEEIYECVNGIYDGGFALLVATDVRVLLVDKKPMNYLTIEDMRFDMISEIDYSHRLLGARISISSGEKNLSFLSYNQPRLRKLIGHVQHCMAEAKKKQSTHQEGQVQHLEKINQQLQAYLIAQHKYQMELQDLQKAQLSGGGQPLPEPVKPSPELSDFLFAQSLLAQHQAQTGDPVLPPVPQLPLETEAVLPPTDSPAPPQADKNEQQAASEMQELYAAGLQEVFGKRAKTHLGQTTLSTGGLFEINPIAVAYSKLPQALRNRKFGLPNLMPKIRPDAIKQSPQAAPGEA